MSMRSVKHIYPAVRDDIADLHTYRALPTPYIDQIDPFLFLNHHGWQNYPPDNRGLPFGPHPHRGFETVTFILEGDIAHRDSGGHESVIGAGGVQWMTAGRGLVHSETSSQAFKQQGGPLEILQLWVNLPARLKMTEPHYVGLQADAIQVYEADGVHVHLASGNWHEHHGPLTPLLDITSMWLTFQAGAHFASTTPLDHNVFFYVVRGSLQVNQRTVEQHQLVAFENDGEDLAITASTDAIVLLCHAQPLGEPVVAHGPFVMNTADEIRQAISDYQAGKFGA